MGLAVSIRRATPEDQDEVVALWKACHLTMPHNNPMSDFQLALGKTNSDILVGINEENKIIGAVMVGHDGHRGWVYYVATHPEHRKKNIGRQMIEAAEHWLKERTIPKIMLMVRDTNTQVIDFYKHLQFEAVPRAVMQKWLINP